MNQSFKIFIFVSTIQYIIDIQIYPCNKLNGHLLLYIHHLVDIYLKFGGFLFNPLYHLISIILTIIHLITNNNQCFLTEWVNKVCYPEYIEYKGFNDFSRMLGLQDKYPDINYYYLFILIIYDLFKLKLINF